MAGPAARLVSRHPQTKEIPTTTDTHQRPLALVTGASTGIGFELAKLLAGEGHDLAIATDRPLADAEVAIRQAGGEIALSLETDLSQASNVDALFEEVQALGRPVAIFCANAGHGIGKAFLDEVLDEAMAVLETNVLGTTRLIWHVGRAMRERGEGRILITSSTAAKTPGPYAGVYFASKAALQSFGQSLRVELKDSGVGVTLLLPGATETEFFRRAGSTDTKGAQGPMDDAGAVARCGYDALMKGEPEMIYGEHNRKMIAETRTKSEAENAEALAEVLKPAE